MIGDAALLCAAFYLSLHSINKTGFVSSYYTVTMSVFVFWHLFLFFVFDLYNVQDRFIGAEYATKLFIAILTGLLTSVPAGFIINPIQQAGFVVLLADITGGILIHSWRVLYYTYFAGAGRRRKFVIVGAGRCGMMVYEDLHKLLPAEAVEVVGVIDGDAKKDGHKIGHVKVMAGPTALTALTQKKNIDAIVVAITKEKRPELLGALLAVKAQGVMVYDVPLLYEELTGKLPVEHLSDGWMVFTQFNGLKRGIYSSRMKRIFDVLLSFIGLALALPIMIVSAIAVKLDSRGPVLFRQKRIGINGRPFNIIKIRTMQVGKENDRRFAGQKRDPRITRVGRLLRMLRLDELPQMLNVLKGDMSFIGPRSLIEEEVNEFQSKIPYFGLRHAVRPGITGWAQVHFRHGTSIEDGLEKLKYDLYYVKNLSFRLDLHILIKTIHIVLLGKGAR